MLPCASVRTLSEEHEAIIIVANHSHIIWVREHIGQSAVFKNPLKSAQMLVKKKNCTEVGTFGNKHFKVEKLAVTLFFWRSMWT